LSPLSSISRASSVDESAASPAADGAVFVDNGLFDDINNALSRMNTKANRYHDGWSAFFTQCVRWAYL
jgi:hypothetical protein